LLDAALLNAALLDAALLDGALFGRTSLDRLPFDWLLARLRLPALLLLARLRLRAGLAGLAGRGCVASCFFFFCACPAGSGRTCSCRSWSRAWRGAADAPKPLASKAPSAVANRMRLRRRLVFMADPREAASTSLASSALHVKGA
jgi:hypothetical protein